MLAVEVLAAASGASVARAILLAGTVQGQPVQILLDSGSSCSCLSIDLANKLSGRVALERPPKVRIADGSLVPCSGGFHALHWTVQGHSF